MTHTNHSRHIRPAITGDARRQTTVPEEVGIALSLLSEAELLDACKRWILAFHRAPSATHAEGRKAAFRECHQRGRVAVYLSALEMAQVELKETGAGT